MHFIDKYHKLDKIKNEHRDKRLARYEM